MFLDGLRSNDIMRCISPAAPAEALPMTLRLDIGHSLPPDQPMDCTSGEWLGSFIGRRIVRAYAYVKCLNQISKYLANVVPTIHPGNNAGR